MGSPARGRRLGFTLGELMVTLAVVAIVAVIALPSYRSIIRTARLTTQIYDFDAALNLARSEAVKRGIPVTVCPSIDNATCGATGTQWEQGWIVFVDKNDDHSVDNGEEVLHANGALVPGYTLRAMATTTPPGYVTFDSKGVASASDIFILCENGNKNPSRAVLVSTAGRIAMAADHDGVPVDADGHDIERCTL